MNRAYLVSVFVNVECKTATTEQEKATIQECAQRALGESLDGKIGPRGEKGAFYVERVEVLTPVIAAEARDADGF